MFVEQRENKTLITGDYVRDAINQIVFPALRLDSRKLTYTESLGMPDPQRLKYEEELKRGKKPYPRVFLRRSAEEEATFVASVVRDPGRPADHVLEPVVYEPLKTLNITESSFIPEHNLIALVGYAYPSVGFPPYPIPVLKAWKKVNEADSALLERLKESADIIFKGGVPHVNGKYYWDVGERVGEWIDYHYGAKPSGEGYEAEIGRKLFAKLVAIYYTKTRFDHPEQFVQIDIAPRLPYNASTDDPEELARRFAYAIEKSRPPLDKQVIEVFFENLCGKILRKLLHSTPASRFEQFKRMDWAALGRNIKRGGIVLSENPVSAKNRLMNEVILVAQKHLVARMKRGKKKSRH